MQTPNQQQNGTHPNAANQPVDPLSKSNKFLQVSLNN